MRVLKLFAIALFASALVTSLALTRAVRSQSGPTEAPAGFDNMPNGVEPQRDANTRGTFLGDEAVFEKVDKTEDGLGPVYNAQSCRECHQNRATGGVSQAFETRAGHSGPNGSFIPAPGRSLHHARAPSHKN